MYDPTKPYREAILDICRSTWDDKVIMSSGIPYPVIMTAGGYKVHHSDGVGTKGLFYWMAREASGVAQDAFAMNLNDLAQIGARPEIMTDHIIVQEEDRDFILAILTNLASLCKEYRCALLGGETSVMDTINGMDLGVTMTGSVTDLSSRYFRAGDRLIGLASNGLHSNGFTKVRQVLGDKLRLEYLLPTRLYWKSVMPMFEVADVRACHITGGAFSKLKPYLPDLDAVIIQHDLEPQPIFHELYNKGVPDREMYQTFNCGIGFVLSVPEEQATQVARLAGGHIIGKVVKGLGQVHIQSKFSGNQVIL